MSAAMAPNEYLKRPYGRVVVPEPDGTFRAEIMEFPGCLATGETAPEALASLEAVAEGWIEATIARGQQVPEPMDGGSHSGKLLVRLGRDLHRRAAYLAGLEGVSLNQFIVSSVAEHIGTFARPFVTYFQPLQQDFTVFLGIGSWRELSEFTSNGDLLQAATPTGVVRVPIGWQDQDEANA